MKILIVGLFLVVFACSESKQELIFIGKNDIEKYFELDFPKAKQKIANSEISTFSIRDQMGMYGCNDSIYLLEKLYVPLSVAGDTAYIVQNEYLTLYFNSKNSNPYAISIEPVGRNPEVAVDKNVLLRERKHTELIIKNARSKYYYVNAKVAQEQVFKNAKVLFVDSICLMPYQKVLEKEGYYLIANYTYTDNSKYLSSVVFTKW